ncbi:MAG: pyruvate kinase [Planctomycetota bacterium]
MRRTKIVCTLGPASGSPGVLSAMLTEGMSIARMNFSHGSHTEHSERLATLRQASRTTGRPVGVLQDLCGPKIRIGVVADGGFNIKPGDMIEMVVDPEGR